MTGKVFAETLELLEAVLKQFDKFGLKLKPSKCKLFLKEIPLLGHIFSDQGVAPDPHKVKSVTDWQSNLSFKPFCDLWDIIDSLYRIFQHSPAPVPTFGLAEQKTRRQ